MSAISIECCVCVEVVASEKQTRRTCGHMMCVGCDAVWRSHGTIMKDLCVTGTDEKFYAYYNSSKCPMCRAEEPAMSYMDRSKESLIHEIQMLSATIHRTCGGYPDAYTAIDLSSMGNKALPSDLLARVAGRTDQFVVPLSVGVLSNPPIWVVDAVLREQYPFIPVRPAAPHRAPDIRRASGVATPVAPPRAAVPVVTPVTLSYAPNATCIRRVQRRGCETKRTKMRCDRCSAFLCRSCTGQCPCSL